MLSSGFSYFLEAHHKNTPGFNLSFGKRRSVYHPKDHYPTPNYQPFLNPFCLIIATLSPSKVLFRSKFFTVPV